MILLEDWDCQTCLPSQKIYRGCTTPAKGKTFFNNELLTRCPRRPLLDDPATYSTLFWLYQNLERGIMPEGPSLNSNPYRLTVMLRIMAAAKGRAQSEKDEEAERKRRRGGKR